MKKYITKNRRAFNVRIVNNGDRYGRKDCILHDREEPLIEFYDPLYPWLDSTGEDRGQFITRYYLQTLHEGESSTRGLLLDGGSPAWALDAETMSEILKDHPLPEPSNEVPNFLKRQAD